MWLVKGHIAHQPTPNQSAPWTLGVVPMQPPVQRNLAQLGRQHVVGSLLHMSGFEPLQCRTRYTNSERVLANLFQHRYRTAFTNFILTGPAWGFVNMSARF